MTREFLKNIKNENRLDKIRLIMKNDDVIGGQPTDDENFTSNTPFLDIACTLKFAINAASTADGKAVAAQTAAATADGKAVAAQTAAATADGKAVTAQTTADAAKTAAANADKKVKPIAEGGTGATTAASARTNLGLKSAATLDKTDDFGTSTNLVATQLLVDKLQKEMNDAIPVGVIVSWDHAEAPKNWLIVRNQKFSATEYPELAKLYPSLMLNDRRGTVDRALDFGRGYDPGRVLGSYQEDAMQKITGRWNGGYANMLAFGSTAMNKDKVYGENGILIQGGIYNPSKGSENAAFDSYSLDSSRETRTAAETRMKNVATNKIIKAK